VPKKAGDKSPTSAWEREHIGLRFPPKETPDMRGPYATAALWATLALYGPSTSFAGPEGSRRRPRRRGKTRREPTMANSRAPGPNRRRLSPRLQLAMKTSTPKLRTRRLVMRRKSSLHLLHRRQTKSRAASLKSASTANLLGASTPLERERQ
jgi:hypothetical protein